MPQLTTTLPSLISFDLYSYFGHVPVVLKVKHDNLVYMENNRIPLWFRHSENTHAIAADIMRNSPVSRSQLARKHKLSQGTLSKITGELLYDGIIEESDAAASPGSAEMRTGDAGRGRPQTALQIAAKSRTYIGVNIHTYECIMQLTDAMCSAICEPLIIHYADNRPENLTALISQGIGQLSQAAAERGFPQPSAAGVTIGGHILNDNTVTFAPFLQWNKNVDFGNMVQEAAHMPAAVFNDLDSLLAYESWFGAGRSSRRFALLTVGLGIGYALCDGGEPVDYPDKSYGMAGHVPVDPDGPVCYAGHKGCSQCLTSPSIAMEYSQLIGHASTFEDFARNAESGKPIARYLVERTCYRLGVLIATVANMAMPEKILIGGESAYLAESALESIRTGAGRYRHSRAQQVQFEILKYGWERWALGGAARVIAMSVKG